MLYAAGPHANGCSSGSRAVVRLALFCEEERDEEIVVGFARSRVNRFPAFM